MVKILSYLGKYLTPMEALVDVRFVDYGNTDSIPRSQLKSAHPALMKAPVFAIRCSLRGVSYNNPNSDVSAQTFIDKMCGESQVFKDLVVICCLERNRIRFFCSNL